MVVSKLLSFTFVFSIISTQVIPIAAEGAEFAITDLGTLGGDNSDAYSINENGQVVGWSDRFGPPSHAFLWENGVMIDLHPSTVSGSQTMSAAFSINDEQPPRIVGWENMDAGFTWAISPQPTTWTVGVTLPHQHYFTGPWNAINDLGDRVGAGSGQPFVKFADGSEYALSAKGQATDINNRSIPLVYMRSADGTKIEGFFGDAPVFHPDDKNSTFPMSVNEANVVVGHFSWLLLDAIRAQRPLPFVRFPQMIQSNPSTVQASFEELPAFDASGFVYGRADAINDNNIIVGESGLRAVIWRNGTVQDLNMLIPPDTGWWLERARDINNAGQIVGVGTIGGHQHAFLLTPVNPCPPMGLSPPTLLDGIISSSYSAAVSATGGVQPYSYSVAAGTLPTGITLSTDGTFTGTPTTVGKVTFNVAATDANGCAGGRTYTMFTCEMPQIPAVVPPGAINEQYSVSLHPVDNTGFYTFAIYAGSLPPGLQLTSDGLIFGQPTANGVYTFTLKVTNPAGCGALKQYTLFVGLCPTITVSPSDIPDGIVGTSYSVAVSASGGLQPHSFSFNLDGGIPPAGLTLSSAGLITGTPTAFGDYYFHVTATDANGCHGGRTYNMSVCAPMDAFVSTLPYGLVSTPYEASLDPNAKGLYTYAVSGGSIPPGLELTSAGAILGKPLVTGTFTFTVKATDGTGCSTFKNYTVNVYTTAPGGGIRTDIDGVVVTFDLVVAAGNTTVDTSAIGPSLPVNYARVGLFSDIQTTATYSGSIEVCLGFESPYTAPEQRAAYASGLRLFHYADGSWEDITTTIGTDSVCGLSASLSPFVLVKPQYTPEGTTCLGERAHAALPPIRVDGTSVFKKGSTVPAKFRVCTPDGVPAGAAGIVSSFWMMSNSSGIASQDALEIPLSTTPDTAFRWDPSGQQWIFNIATGTLSAQTTYRFRAYLNDGSAVDFQFGLK